MSSNQIEVDRLPKKILRVKDLTFQLPDDFEGDFGDAVTELVRYLQTTEPDCSREISGPNPDTTKVFLETKEEGDLSKVCGTFGIFELVNGHYQLIDSNHE